MIIIVSHDLGIDTYSVNDFILAASVLKFKINKVKVAVLLDTTTSYNITNWFNLNYNKLFSALKGIVESLSVAQDAKLKLKLFDILFSETEKVFNSQTISNRIEHAINNPEDISEFKSSEIDEVVSPEDNNNEDLSKIIKKINENFIKNNIPKPSILNPYVTID